MPVVDAVIVLSQSRPRLRLYCEDDTIRRYDAVPTPVDLSDDEPAAVFSGQRELKFFECELVGATC